jgi:hypothetical protein
MGVFGEPEPPLDGGSARVHPEGGGRGANSAGGGDERPRPARSGLAPTEDLTIERDGSSLAFRSPARLRLVRVDGEKRKRDTDAGTIEVVAQWRKNGLEVSSRTEVAGRRSEKYRVRDDGRLEVEISQTGQGPIPALTFRLVYDRAANVPAPVS